MLARSPCERNRDALRTIPSRSGGRRSGAPSGAKKTIGGFEATQAMVRTAPPPPPRLSKRVMDRGEVPIPQTLFALMRAREPAPSASRGRDARGR